MRASFIVSFIQGGALMGAILLLLPDWGFGKVLLLFSLLYTVLLTQRLLSPVTHWVRA